MYHNHGVEKKKYSLLLLRGHQIYSSFGYYDSSSLACYGQSVEIYFPFYSPEPITRCLVHICGSFNGLLLIIEIPLDYFYGTLISLWNPATSEYKEIPEPPYEGLNFMEMELDASIDTCLLRGFTKITYGFGYDCKIEDYKVVRVTTTHGACISQDSDEKIYFGCKVKIYTLGSNSWKYIPFIFPYKIGSSDGVFINGALHWRATPWNRGIRDSKYKIIVSFDFENEIFTDISPLAEHLDEVHDEKIFMTLGNMGGCLCLFAEDLYRIDVSVMKEYGVRESWTKLFTIARPSLGIYSSDNLDPIQFFKNGEILLSIELCDDDNEPTYLDQCALVLYDPKYENFSTLKIPGGNWELAHTYIENLVSLNSGTYLGQMKNTT